MEGPPYIAPPGPEAPAIPALPPRATCLETGEAEAFQAAYNAYERGVIARAAAARGWTRLGEPRTFLPDEARVAAPGRTWVRVAAADPCFGGLDDDYFVDAKGGVFAWQPARTCGTSVSLVVCDSLPGRGQCGHAGSFGGEEPYYVEAPKGARYITDGVVLRYRIETCVELAPVDGWSKPG